MPETGTELGGRGRNPPGRGREGWRFIAPGVLLLLADGPSHGYHLMSRLDEVYPRSGRLPDPSSFYRVMRAMEGEGSVGSSWEADRGGPARRVYTLTDVGREQLDAWSLSIQRDVDAAQRFLRAYAQLGADSGTAAS